MDKIKVRPIAMTQPLVDFIPDGEGLMSYCARVSNPSNQDNFSTADKLLRYCANHSHWSVFEMVNIVIEIEAPRDISRQILRHKSGAFQEFSQRYAEVSDDMFCIRETRLQDSTNRQNSIETTDSELAKEWETRQQEVINLVKNHYRWALDSGVAKEQARVILPEGNTMSRMYVNFNVRSLVHWLQVRSSNGTQKEHMEVAEKVLDVCAPLFPESWESLTDFSNN